MLQGPAMLPTTITSEVTQLKEKVRVLEVRFLQSVWVNSVECQCELQRFSPHAMVVAFHCGYCNDEVCG